MCVLNERMQNKKKTRIKQKFNLHKILTHYTHK